MPFIKNVIPWNKGKTMNLEYCLALRQPRKKLSLEARRNQSIGKMGNKNGCGNRGKVRSDQTRKTLREKLSNRVFSVLTKERMSLAGKNKIFSEEHRKHMSNASQGNSNWATGKVSKPQQALRDELVKRGFTVKDNLNVFDSSGNRIHNIDCFLPAHSLCVLADGCYWHRCDCRGFNDASPRRISDNLVTGSLISSGFKVIRFWEHEILSSVSNCVDRVNLLISEY